MNVSQIKASNDKAIARWDEQIETFTELVKQSAELTEKLKSAVVITQGQSK